MSLKDIPAYICDLLKECEKLNLKQPNSDIHTTLKSIYRIIKKSSSEVLIENPLKDEDYQKIYFSLRSLTLILIDVSLPTDVILLCGTCLSLLIASLFNPEFTSSFLIYLYCYFDSRYSGSQNILNVPKVDLEKEIDDEIRTFLFNSESYIPQAHQTYEAYLEKTKNLSISKTPSFQQIAIMNGIVSCQIPKLYSFKLHSLPKDKPFLLFIFDPVHQCCLSPSVHQYHAFHILLNWLRMCELNFNFLVDKGSPFFQTEGEVVQNILSLLESNWQSPIKGTNAFIKDMYKCLINLNEMECKMSHSEGIKLLSYLLKKTMLLSWQVKGKYFLLSVLLQYIDYLQLFETNLDATINIIFSMKANYIASSAAEVYKVVVTNMKKSGSETNLSSEWSRWWLEPILNCLHSNNRLLIQNVTNNILPWTMKQFPKSYELLMENERSPDDSVKLLLLRIAKGNLSCTLEEKELILIEKNLHHSSIQIRTEVLSILCSSPKKSRTNEF